MCWLVKNIDKSWIGSPFSFFYKIFNITIYSIYFKELCQEIPNNETSSNDINTSSCEYWTYYQKLTKCFILDSCNENDDPEAESGNRNCPPGDIQQFPKTLI